MWMVITASISAACWLPLNSVLRFAWSCSSVHSTPLLHPFTNRVSPYPLATILSGDPMVYNVITADSARFWDRVMLYLSSALESVCELSSIEIVGLSFMIPTSLSSPSAASARMLYLSDRGKYSPTRSACSLWSAPAPASVSQTCSLLCFLPIVPLVPYWWSNCLCHHHVFRFGFSWRKFTVFLLSLSLSVLSLCWSVPPLRSAADLLSHQATPSRVKRADHLHRKL